MKKLLTLCSAVLVLVACESPSGGNDGGNNVTLKFAAGTRLAIDSPADDADTATAGFQYDVVIEPANSDTSGSVVFKVNDATQATVAFASGKATGRLTFETADAGTDSINVVSAARESGVDVPIAWIFTVHNN